MPLEAACRRQRILLAGFESSGKIKAAGGDPPQAVSFVKNNFIEMNVEGTEVWVKVSAEFENFEPWIQILVDGSPSQRIMLNKGEYNICVFRNMEPGNVRNIRILKDTPAFPTDEKAVLQILEVHTDGKFLPLKPAALKMEVIGDSITSGEGCSGAGKEMTWNSFCFNAVDNYAYMVAEELGAVYNCISQSGWGVFCSWEGDEQQAIPLYYEQVCGLLTGERNKELGAFEKWDFHKFQPDIVVVNLGTNDGSGTRDMEKIENAVKGFLKKIRTCNPECYILWCYGMLGDGICPTLQKAVWNYKMKSGDEHVEFVKLPDTREGEFGSRQHPGHKSHEKTAKILAEKIRRIMSR